MLPHYVEALQSHRWRQRVGGGEEQADSGRERERKKERESLWSSVSLSVSLYPSNHAAIQTNTDRQSPHAHTHTHTHIYWCRLCACFRDPFCRRVLKPSNVAVKRGRCLTASLQALQEDAEGQTGLLWEGVAATTKGIRSLAKVTDIHDAFRLPNTSALFSEHRREVFRRGLDVADLPRTSGWRQCEWGWVLECVRHHWHWQTT